MKKFVVACALATLAWTGSASAAVLTFDDVSTPRGGYAQLGSYGGLHWSNMYAMDPMAYYGVQTGFSNGVVSGNKMAFNGYGTTAAATSGAFNFQGVYLTSWAASDSFTVIGKAAGSTLYSQTVSLNSSGPTWFDFNFNGIDELQFQPVSGGGHWFAMDNFTFNTQLAGVPELDAGGAGSALTLLLGCCLVMAGRRRRLA